MKPQEMARWIARRKETILNAWARHQLDKDLLARYHVAGAEDPDFLKDAYVRPLLDLLIGYFESGNAVYRLMYLDERSRYAPFGAEPAVRARFFSEVLAKDEGALLADLSPDSDAGRTFRDELSTLHAPLVSLPAERPVRLLVMGDCLFNEIRVFLGDRCRAAGFTLDFRSRYFSAEQGVGLSVEDVLRYLEEFPADLIAFGFLSYQGLPLYASLMRQADLLSRREALQQMDLLLAMIGDFLTEVRKHTEATFLVHNTCGLPLSRWRSRLPFLSPHSAMERFIVDELNTRVAALVRATPRAILIDEKRLAEERGLRVCMRNVLPRKISPPVLFHTAHLGYFLSDVYANVLRSFHLLKKTKVILVDFDNTLWKGVAADGEVVQDAHAQRLLRRLREGGILLVALSKNDPENIRWDEMVLKPADFALQKISWKPKLDSIQEAADELNLGLDSFILVDDNPVERELVRLKFPMITTLDSADPFTWEALTYLESFPAVQHTEEARERTALYQTQAKRKRALSSAADFGTMMAALGLVVRFGPAGPKDLVRAEELIQRTNQFNTTSVRYSRRALESFLQSPDYAAYVAEMRDKFGDLGIVSVVVVERQGPRSILRSFVMSCRAIGFQLERVVLGKVMEQESRATEIVGLYIPNDRNGPAAGLYRENGFVATSSTEWLRPQNGNPFSYPAWFTIQERPNPTPRADRPEPDAQKAAHNP